MGGIRIGLGLGAAALASCVAVSAASADDFFNGREIKLIVGTGSGGGYDAYARLVGRFMSRTVPGNPSFVVQNMPGASGIKAVNYLYSVAPKDGSVIATFNNSMPVYQALKQPGVQFATEKLSWIGAMSNTVTLIAVWHATGVKTVEDAKRIEVVMGATGTGGTMAGYPALLNSALGTKFKIVTGYEGGNALNLALERGEVQGRGTLSWSSVKTGHPDWYRDKTIVPLVQVGMHKEPDLPDVPLLIDLAQTDEQRQMFYFVSAPNAMDRPFAGPPDIPADRLNILRAAFDAVANDPEFRAVAQRQDLPIDPTSGADLAAIVARIVGTSAAIVEKTRQAMGKGALE